MSCISRKPIVGVNDVVAHTIAQSEERNLFGELRHVLKKLMLRNLLGRSGCDRNDPDAIVGILDFRGFRIGSSRENVDREAPICDVIAQFTHVNVHSAGVLASKARQRRGVGGNSRRAGQCVGLVAEHRWTHISE